MLYIEISLLELFTGVIKPVSYKFKTKIDYDQISHYDIPIAGIINGMDNFHALYSILNSDFSHNHYSLTHNI